MGWILTVLLVCILIGILGGLLFLLLRSEQRARGDAFRGLREGVEGLERNILASQREFEKLQEMRGVTLRQELQQSSTIIEKRMGSIETRLDERLNIGSRKRNTA